MSTKSTLSNSTQRNCAPWPHGFVCVALFGLSPFSGFAASPAVEYLADHPGLILSDAQNWGALGFNSAAHEPNKAGVALRIGSQSYTNGLGHHANGKLVVWLGGQFKHFEAGVGLQPCPGGSVIFRVSADDKVLFDSGIMRSGDEAKPVNVSIVGADELVLEALDAGDGVSCDMANWANARLVRDSTAQTAEPGAGVDMAPFATVRAWDPARLTGTTASRLEPIPAEELFLGAPMRRETNGTYLVLTFADGRGCFGIEWLERRRLQRLELQFATDSTVPEQAEVQYWQMGYKDRPEGGSSWQGQWQPLAGMSKKGLGNIH